MKKIFSFVCSFIILGTIYSQEKKGYFAEHIIVGTSFFYTPDVGIEDEMIHHEITWNNNVSISITKKINLGAEFRYIRTSGSTRLLSPPDPTVYYMAGLFSQIDILETEKFRFFGQLGFDIGNYCSCDREADPFKLEDRRYLGWGFGVNYRIFENFSLDAHK
jgi:hypothetical protein